MFRKKSSRKQAPSSSRIRGRSAAEEAGRAADEPQKKQEKRGHSTGAAELATTVLARASRASSIRVSSIASYIVEKA
jgi:hypothetical protein